MHRSSPWRQLSHKDTDAPAVDSETDSPKSTVPPLVQPTEAIPVQPTEAELSFVETLHRTENSLRPYQLASASYASVTGDVGSLSARRTSSLQPFLTRTVPVLFGSATGENRLYAPLNVYLALSMVTELTDGETRQELLDLLSASDAETLRTTCKMIWEASSRENPDGFTLLQSDSIWLRDATRYNEETLRTLSRYYYAPSFSGKMGTAEYDAAIAEWINAHTGGLLREQAAGMHTDKETLAVLLSAIYFKAGWTESFYAFRTAPQDFHAPDGDVRTDFLNGGEETSAWTENGFTAIGKPLYGGTAMYFLLPDEGTSPEELLTQPDALAFIGSDEGRDALPHRKCLVTFACPKFDVNSDLDLIAALHSLGVSKAFDPETADFSPLLAEDSPCFLQGVLHAARVKIDEKGCEAAAFSEFVAGATAPPQEPERLTLILDRPFAFVITGPAGLPLFIGVVNHPNR